jgi:hypothetical protein
LTIVLFVFLRFTDSEYPFGIFKLFFHIKCHYKNPSVYVHYRAVNISK